MAKKRPNNPYYCTKCKTFHRGGLIYDDHKNYNAGLVIQKIIKNKCQFVSENIIEPEGILKIQDLEKDEIINKINILYKSFKDQIDEGKLPSVEIPLRRRENIVYNDQNCYFLGKKTRKLMLGDKYNDFLRILQISRSVKDLLEKDLHATKREIYYSDVKLFDKQKFSDISIEDLAAFLGTFRDNLHIVSMIKGYCLGRLKVRDKSDIIDLENIGTRGWYISPFQDNVEIIESDAEFILVLEKDAVMMRLAEEKFWDTVPCILVTASGSPDYNTRKFLKKLVSELKIPVFGLADSDPYGLSILMTYAYGSVQSAHETSKLAVNNMYWLGLMPKDIEEYNINNYCRLPMNREDFRKLDYLLREHPILKRDKLREQLELTLKIKKYVDVQAISHSRLDFLSEYIINKIEKGDFIKF